MSISVFALSCSGSLYFSDWGTEEAAVGWEQYGGNEARTGHAPCGVDPPLKLQARMKVGSAIMGASPLVRGRAIYAVGVDGRARAWDRKTGASLGKWRSKGRVLETPAFWNGLLVLPKCGKKAELVALDMLSGKRRWRLKGESVSAPLIAGDRLFVTTASGSVIGLNTADGTERRRFEMGGATFSAAMGDTVLYVGSDEAVVALGESCGALLWKRETAGGIRATPAVGEDGVYVGSTGGVVYRLDRASGEIIWTFELEAGIYGGCALDSARVYFGATDRALYALDRSTGQLVWRFETRGVIRAAPVTTGRTVYVGSMDRFFYGVAADSGALRWKHETKGAIVSAPALVGDGVYIGSTDGFLYAFGRK